MFKEKLLLLYTMQYWTKCWRFTFSKQQISVYLMECFVSFISHLFIHWLYRAQFSRLHRVMLFLFNLLPFRPRLTQSMIRIFMIPAGGKTAAPLPLLTLLPCPGSWVGLGWGKQGQTTVILVWDTTNNLRFVVKSVGIQRKENNNKKAISCCGSDSTARAPAENLLLYTSQC